jgi:type I restriction enzyme M protein
VILLPDNLFYNTNAAGVIIVLRKQKSKDRRGKIVIINASAEFKKGQPKNFISTEGIKKIAEAYNEAKDIDGFVKVIANEEAAKNDFALSPSRYLVSGPTATLRKIPELVSELKSLDALAAEVNADLNKVLAQL